MIKIMKRPKRKLTEVKRDIKEVYGRGASALINKINPITFLEKFYPALYNAYSDGFKKELFEEWAKKKGLNI